MRASRDFGTIKEDEVAYQVLRTIALRDRLFLLVVDVEGRPVGYVSRSTLSEP